MSARLCGAGLGVPGLTFWWWFVRAGQRRRGGGCTDGLVVACNPCVVGCHGVVPWLWALSLPFRGVKWLARVRPTISVPCFGAVVCRGVPCCLRCALLCCVALFCAVLRCALLCRAVPCPFVPWSVLPWHGGWRHAVPRRVVSCCAVLCPRVPCPVALHSGALCCGVLCCFVLCHALLCRGVRLGCGGGCGCSRRFPVSVYPLPPVCVYPPSPVRGLVVDEHDPLWFL